MKLGELKSIAAGTPAVYQGRKKVERGEFKKPFEIDEIIIVRLSPKMVKDEDGEVQEMVDRNGNPIYDKLIYLPFTDGKEKYLTMTKSPLIYRLVKNLPVVKEEDGLYDGEIVKHFEAIEGKLQFTNEKYSYGEKSVPVLTLEEAE